MTDPPAARRDGGGQGDDQGPADGDHLLDRPFLASLHALLRPAGTLVVVTDNRAYAGVCAATAFGVRDAGTGSPGRVFH